MPDDNYDSSIIVQNWLKDHNIPFTTEQTFEGLVGQSGAHLRFDIYLEQHKMCIEVDGQQHYRACKNVNMKTFLKKRNHDRRKEWYCYTHGLFLLRLVWDELAYLDQILGFLLKWEATLVQS